MTSIHPKRQTHRSASRPQIQTPVQNAGPVSRIVTFTPTRVDSGETRHVIVGTLGELARIDEDGNALGDSVTPFPAAIPCSTQIEGGWLGIWIEPEHRLARMARLNLDAEWQDGSSRGELRTSLVRNMQPASAEWTRSMDAEPTAVSRTETGFCFALRGRGIYHLDSQANEIWRAKLPSVLDGRRRGLETAISMHASKDKLSVWYDNGLVVQLSMDDGSEIDRRNLNASERIEAVFHSDSQHFIALAGGGISIQDENGVLESHATPGPVFAARRIGETWEFTGWRHDGRLDEKGLSLAERPEIGVGFVGQRVLSNDGTLAAFGITRS